MMDDASDDPHAEFVQAWRERFARARHENEAAAARALEKARCIAVALVRNHGARRVTLIGSLARGDFGPHSDIDLVVEGLADDRFWAACAEADRIGDEVAVDLVPLESAGALLRKRLASEGKVLSDDS